jgi:RHS repeat-associated protein
VSFRKPDAQPEYVATMETTNLPKQQEEEREFKNITQTRDITRGQGSSLASAKLTDSQPLGPWKSLPVGRGEKVKGIEVYAFYTNPSNQTPGTGSGLSPFITLNPNYGNTGGENAPSSNFNLSTLQAGLVYSPSSQNPDNQAPTAYIKYIFYDKDNNYVSSQIKYVTIGAKDNSQWEKLTLPDFVAEQDGYLQVFVANESNMAVWFDNLKFNHEIGLVVQENHYDPWGLNLVGIEKNGNPNHRYQYNGKEKQEEFGLNWMDYGARMYSADVPRWWTIDPKAEKYYSTSSYVYALNNPIIFIDPNGKEVVPATYQEYVDYVIASNKNSKITEAQLRELGKIVSEDVYNAKMTELRAIFDSGREKSPHFRMLYETLNTSSYKHKFMYNNNESNQVIAIDENNMAVESRKPNTRYGSLMILNPDRGLSESMAGFSFKMNWGTATDGQKRIVNTGHELTHGFENDQGLNNSDAMISFNELLNSLTDKDRETLKL